MARYVGCMAVWRRARGAGVVAVWAATCGCSSPDSGMSRGRDATAGLDRAERYVASVPAGAGSRNEAGGGQAAILVSGEPVAWSRLMPALSESAGAIAIEEAALDLLLEREAAKAGVRATAEDIDAERRAMVETMASGGDAARGEAALRQVRRERGLGENRFAALLRRNALMRKLVEAEVSVTPLAVDQAYELRYGERIGARIITTATADEASAAAARIRAGEAFNEVAARVSNDASAVRGGLIEPVSPADPSYPASIRKALMEAQPGALTPVIAIERGFALLQRDPNPAPGSGAERPDINAVRADLERDARRRQERLLMARLGKRLMESASITVMDPALNQSWLWRRNEGAELLPPRR